MTPAPIAIFCFNRLTHLQETVRALQANPLAGMSEVFFFSDGARNGEDHEKVLLLREYLEKVTGFHKVTVISSPENKGLSMSVIDGVTRLVNTFGRVIVLEDDMVTSPFFLEYMNAALDKFEKEDRVISVHGYSYPIQELKEPFFLKGADCWGWGTWKRGWNLFESNGALLLKELKQKGLLRRFNFNGAFPYEKMLRRQIRGENSSWAVRWYASALINDKLTLYPGHSLIYNTGNDGSGTHSKKNRLFDPVMAESKPQFEFMAVEESEVAYRYFRKYFRRIYFRSVLLRIGSLFSRP
jgi:hypothetical protein